MLGLRMSEQVKRGVRHEGHGLSGWSMQRWIQIQTGSCHQASGLEPQVPLEQRLPGTSKRGRLPTSLEDMTLDRVV